MERRTHEVVPLDPAKVDLAAEVLTRAFMDDPLQCYTLPDAGERARLSPSHFGAMIRYGLLAGEVWTTTDLGGVAVWAPPEHREFNDDAAAESGLARLGELIGQSAAERFLSVIDFTETLHARNAPGPHWYAFVIGVDAKRQGTGVGGALLGSVSGRADEARVPVYLETAQPENVSFYTKHGFAVIDEVVEPISGLKLWTFLRDAK